MISSVAIIGLFALALPATAAMAQHSGAPSGAPRALCLSNEDRELIVKLKALNRPTTEKDPTPPFDPDYFVGTWTMEWDAPESALAAEGMHTGTLTFKHVDGCYYEGELNAKGPGGAYKSRIQVMYDPLAKYLTWIETDPRGAALFKPGTIGADSGGYFTHYFETQAFKSGTRTHRPRDSHFPTADHLGFRSKGHRMNRPRVVYFPSGVLVYFSSGATTWELGQSISSCSWALPRARLRRARD